MRVRETAFHDMTTTPAKVAGRRHHLAPVPGSRLGLVSALALLTAGCGSSASVHSFFEAPTIEQVAEATGVSVPTIPTTVPDITDVTPIAPLYETIVATANEVVGSAAIQAANIADAYTYVDPATGDPKPLTGIGSVVAIMSDGVDGTHPELAGKVIGGYNTVLDSDSYAPTVRHLCVARINTAINDCDPGTYGTEMAGVIASSQNGTGIQGVAPNARIFAINAADEVNDFGINGDANATAYDRALAAGAKIFVHGYGKGVDYTQEDEMRNPETALVQQLLRTAEAGAVHIYGAGSARQHIWNMTDWENNARPDLQGELPLWHEALRNGSLIVATSGYTSGRLARSGMSEDTELALLNWITDTSVGGAERARRRSAVDAVTNTDPDTGVETLVSYDRNLFAMANDAAWCKGAAMWCLVVTPSSANLVASDGIGTTHQNEDPDGDGYRDSWTHGNNAAAVVAGAMTLLKQAFPYLTEKEIATILLDTASYMAPDSAGITEYTVNGVRANEKFGRGMLDVAAALQPAGATAFAIGSALSTAHSVPLSATVASMGGVLEGFADAFDRPLVFFDSYGRAFPIDAAALASDTGGFDDGLDRLTRVLGLSGGVVAMAPRGLDSLSFGRDDTASDGWHAGYGGEATFSLGAGDMTLAFSPNGTTAGIAGAGAMLGRTEAAPFQSGHLSFTENEASASYAQKAGWGGTVSLSAGFSSDADDETRIVAQRLTADYTRPMGEDTALGLRVGYAGRNDGAILGAETQGAFSLANTVETTFLEATLTHRLTETFALVGQAQWGRSWADAPEASFARLDGPLDTGALRIGIDAASMLTKGDRLSLSAGTALHPVSGTMRLDYAVGRDAAGTILTETHDIDLAGGRPPLEARFDYTAPLTPRTDIAVTAALRDEADKDPQGDIFFGFNTRF